MTRKGPCPVPGERFPSRCAGEALLHYCAESSSVVSLHPIGEGDVLSQLGSKNYLALRKWIMNVKTAVVAGILVVGTSLAAEVHVAKNGADAGDGTAQKPFLTIQRAADIAQPGDVITVHEGVYRERVNPSRGGTSDDNRIVYRAAPGEQVVIKGSEVSKGWKNLDGDTWQVVIPNRVFGGFNPYNDPVQGAWYEAKQAYHTGAVYLNGHWLKEAARKDLVVKSLASGDAEGGAAELMNIQSFILGTGTHLDATDFVAKSDSVKVVKDDPNKIFVGRMTDGSFVAYNMDFGEEAKFMSLVAASPISGGIIEMRLDSLDGELIGHVDVGFTAEWTHFQRFHANISPMSGVHKVYCVFKARPAPAVDPAKEFGSWFAEVDEQNTTIWADIKGKNPNDEFVEINVRQSVFYPKERGVDYITVQGFTLEHAASGWASATSEQFGLIGTHWSRGWVIENNTIRYSVGTGVTLGKYGDEHDETYDYRGITIPCAVENGWSEIGHHVVKGNRISHCAKNGVHGSLGAPFSTIVGNEIHDIKQNHDFGGCDTAGIKVLGGVDLLIADNHIYNCKHWGGIWLDWMAQGARVTGNLLHDNSQDLMFEVNHGPHLVDNNLLLSRVHVTEASGGGAFVHNLWLGSINIWPDLRVRKTPYFKPHSVDIIGQIDIDQNDDRYYNNVFIGPKGTAAYDEPGFKIAAVGNVFLSGAKPSTNEVNPLVSTVDPAVKLEQKADGWWLEMTSPALSGSRPLVTSDLLGKAVVPDAQFENRNGTPYHIDTDYFGKKRSASNPDAGPFQGVEKTKVRLKVWPKK